MAPTHDEDDQQFSPAARGHAQEKQARGEDIGSDGTSNQTTMRAPHPIFAIVNAPMVTSMSREALVEWLKLRKEYEEHTQERCKDEKKEMTAVIKSVKCSFDANVLETLCEVCWGVKQSTVTDEFLLEKIHEITDSFQNQELPDVREIFRKELRMNTTNLDIDARVIEYFHLCNTLVKKHGFTSFFESERGGKEKCKLIVSSLPNGIRHKVQNELDFRCPEAKNNIRKLYELVRLKTREQAIEERALSKVNSSRRKQTRDDPKREFQQKKRRNEKQEHRSVKRVKSDSDTSRSQRKVIQTSHPTAKGVPKQGCFHCEGPHYLSDCPTATPAERDKLLAERTGKSGHRSPGKARHR